MTSYERLMRQMKYFIWKKTTAYDLLNNLWWSIEDKFLFTNQV